MIHFMVDFENTRSQGLQGVSYLLPEDSVTIFYSQACIKAENGKLQQMFNAHSNISVCKLKNTGKNALDFYIASKIGEVYGSGYEGTVAIVSKDKGYKAVRDYWQYCVPKPRSIILQPDIGQCIVSSNENSERRKQIQQQLQSVNLETEFAKYEERVRIQKLLKEEFAGTRYEDMIGQIQDILRDRKKPKILYLNALKAFGRKDGIEIYRKVKELDCG